MKDVIHQTTDTKIVVDGKEYKSIDELPQEIQDDIRRGGLESLGDLLNASENKQTKVIGSGLYIPKSSLYTLFLFIAIVIGVGIYHIVSG